MRPIRKTVTYNIDTAVLATLDAWLGRQPVRPSKSAVVEMALKTFLSPPKRAVVKGARHG